MNKFMKIVSVITLLIFLRTGFALASDQVYFYYTDPAGTPMVMSDSTGTVVWRADYMPFGEETIDQSTVPNNKMFAGKEKDSESGLYYFGARYMDAGVGRFVSPDSIGPIDTQTGRINDKILLNPQMLNLYAYSMNNPDRFIDPDGLSPADRVAWAISQLNNNKDYWKGTWRRPWKCNVFVAAAHDLGDPDVVQFPSVLREQSRLDKKLGTFISVPTVENLADPNFMRSELAYLPLSDAQAGDIIVWFGNGTHHSALYIGDDKVIYQSNGAGVKENTIEGTTEGLKFKGNPVVRRYIYPQQ